MKLIDQAEQFRIKWNVMIDFHSNFLDRKIKYITCFDNFSEDGFRIIYGIINHGKIEMDYNKKKTPYLHPEFIKEFRRLLTKTKQEMNQ